MARRKAAPARPTKTAARKGGARKSTARTAAARKTRSAGRKTGRSRAKKPSRPARKTAKAARKTTRKTVRKSQARRTSARAVVGKTVRRTGRKPALDRERRRLPDEDIVTATPPSSLDLDRRGTAARTGKAELDEKLGEHTEAGPAITAGDVDADWESAYAVGDEAPGGDNPTPDQDVVEDIGKALGVEYQDNEELKSSDKIVQRDKHRWELDPASSDDWNDR